MVSMHNNQQPDMSENSLSEDQDAQVIGDKQPKNLKVINEDEEA
jgi:hypothetical protein